MAKFGSSPLVLDCESFASTVHSFAQALDRSPAELENLVRAFDEEAVDAAGDDPVTAGPWALLGTFGISRSSRPFEGVFYFHATRVPDPSAFERDGIRPLGKIVDSIWRFLYSLVAEKCSIDAWTSFRLAFENDLTIHAADLYRLKLSNAMHHGPHAELIRAVFTEDLTARHDYLDIPEIVEDIAMGARYVLGVSLDAPFRQATQPCIVKFCSCEPDERNVEAAARFMLDRVNGHSLHPWGGYMGEGTAVPPKAITTVEIVREQREGPPT